MKTIQMIKVAHRTDWLSTDFSRLYLGIDKSGFRSTKSGSYPELVLHGRVFFLV